MSITRDTREVESLPSWRQILFCAKILNYLGTSITHCEDNTASEQRRHGISKEKH